MARVNAVSFHENPSLEDICRIVLDTGFDSLEVSRPPFYNKLTTRGVRDRFAAWCRDRHLSLYGFDCWVEVEPYDAFDETLADFERALDFARDLDLGMVISHDPWAHVNGDRAPDECMKINVDLFRRVCRSAVDRGLRMTFEPHPDTLSMDDSWAIDFIDSIGEGLPPGSVGILWDCCHYGVGQPDTYVQSIAALGDRIRHIHFSDGDATTYALHLPLGDGVLDLDAIIEALKTGGCRASLTNDLYSYPLLEEGCRRNVDPIREVERRLGEVVENT